MDKKKVTVVVYPDEDGGYTALMPYFSCHLITQGDCLTAQGETADEALAEAGRLLVGYLALGATRAAITWSARCWRGWRCGSWKWMWGSKG